MKVRTLSLVAALLFAISSSAFSAEIPITGEHNAWGAPDFTYYATPVAAGATYTWHVYSGTILAQNTDPSAGPLYVTIRWYTPGLYQDYVEIADNQGNSGSFDVYVAVIPTGPSFGANESTVNEGLNNFKATGAYARPEAILPERRTKFNWQ